MAQSSRSRFTFIERPARRNQPRARAALLARRAARHPYRCDRPIEAIVFFCPARRGRRCEKSAEFGWQALQASKRLSREIAKPCAVGERPQSRVTEVTR